LANEAQFYGTGRRKTDLTDVEVEVEVRIVHPIGMVEPERHLHHAAAQRSDVTDEGTEPFVHGGVGVELRIRTFVDSETVHVPVRRRRLHVEERRVEPGELLHRPSLPRVTVTGHGDRSARWTTSQWRVQAVVDMFITATRHRATCQARCALEVLT